MPTASFKAQGMCCAEEVAVLRRELAVLPVVEEVSFDIAADLGVSLLVVANAMRLLATESSQGANTHA